MKAKTNLVKHWLWELFMNDGVEGVDGNQKKVFLYLCSWEGKIKLQSVTSGKCYSLFYLFFLWLEVRCWGYGWMFGTVESDRQGLMNIEYFGGCGNIDRVGEYFDGWGLETILRVGEWIKGLRLLSFGIFLGLGIVFRVEEWF